MRDTHIATMNGFRVCNFPDANTVWTALFQNNKVYILQHVDKLNTAVVIRIGHTPNGFATADILYCKKTKKMFNICLSALPENRILIEENENKKTYSPRKGYSQDFLSSLLDSPSDAFCEYDGKSLYVLADDLDAFLSYIYSHHNRFHIASHVPTTILNLMQIKHHTEIDAKKCANIPCYLNLYPYQQNCLHTILQHNGRLALFNDMGTGKTAISIAALEYFRAPHKQQLVLCPASLSTNWQHEIAMHTTREAHIIRKARDRFIPDQINIMSYSLVRRFPPDFWKAIQIDILICDESHHLKNKETQISKHVTKLAVHIPRILLLSGTPASRPAEFYPQLRILIPDIVHEFTRLYRPSSDDNNTLTLYFGDRYCNPTKKWISRSKQVWDFQGIARPAELNAILSKVAVRLRKEDVITLPPKNRFILQLGDSKRENKIHWRKTMLHLQNTREQSGDMLANIEINQLILKNLTAKIALMDTKTILSKIIPIIQLSPGKILLFAHHKAMIDKITETLTASGFQNSYITITGETNLKTRADLVDSFQSNDHDSPTIAILSIKAAGTGLNLFKASTIIFFELLWSNKDMIQAEDRAHRLGQTRPVNIYYIIQPDTIDQLVFDIMVKKEKNTHLILDNTSTDFDISDTRAHIA